MKNYFPFTDYDFYAYLTSGGFMLAVLDYAFNDATLLLRAEWGFVGIVAAIAVAYVAGHIVATLSHLVLETRTSYSDPSADTRTFALLL